MPRAIEPSRRVCLLGAFSLLALLGASAVTRASSPALVRDIREVPPEYSHSFPLEFTVLGDLVYFKASTWDRGGELWVTDGTAEGTREAVDICGGACDSNPGGFFRLADWLIFSADDDVHGREIWRSDGTVEGTELIKDIRPGFDESVFSLPWLAAGGLVYVLGDDVVHGRELWRTDGTPDGTLLLADIYPGPRGSSPFGLVEMDGVVYFGASDPERGRELWRTDGTPHGTYLVMDLNPGTGSSLRFDYFFGVTYWIGVLDSGELLLAADDGSRGRELWISDGTAQGTTLLKDIRPGPDSSEPTGFHVFGGVAYFRADDGVHGDELWRTDGTPEGTRLVADIHPEGGSSSPSAFAHADDVLLFVADDGEHGRELWRTDGSQSGTWLLKDVRPGSLGSDAWVVERHGSTVYLVADDGTHGLEPWTSDGTSEGTRLLRDIFPGPESSVSFLWPFPSFFTPFGDQVLFRAMGSVEEGLEPWISDGTEGGTRLLEDINRPPGSSEPEHFVEIGGRALFAADDGIHGNEPWVSDGTTAGTGLLGDLRTGDGGSSPVPLGAVDGRLLLSLADETYGRELWSTDGTEADTWLVADIRPGPESGDVGTPMPAAGSLFFRADDGTRGDELWQTDGTPEGTGLVRDIWPGSSSSRPYGGVDFGGLLYFTAYAPGPSDLWRSDGTAGGTEAVLPAVLSISYPTDLTVAGELLFFSADTSGPGANRELWVTDGSTEGTRVVAEIRPGELGGVPDRGSGEEPSLAALGDLLLFVGNDGLVGEELWRSDGTESGTTLVADIHQGAADSSPRQFTQVGGQLYFVAHEAEHGQELWVTDGTLTGTRMVRDIHPGPGHSTPRDLHAHFGRLFFSATDGEHGVELWSSDGTAAGTTMVGDGNPGKGSSSPSGPASVGERLYFSATDGVTGFEPWAFRLPVADLAVTKTNGVDAVVPWRPVTYVVAVHNAGPGDAESAVLTDAPGPNLVDCSWSCTGTDGGACLDRAGEGAIEAEVVLPSGGRVVVVHTCSVTPVPLGEAVNRASVALQGVAVDPHPGNDSAFVSTDVVTPGGCGWPEELELSSISMPAFVEYRACRRIEAGPEVAVEPGGEVILHGGEIVVLGNGVSVEAGGRLGLRLDP